MEAPCKLCHSTHTSTLARIGSASWAKGGSLTIVRCHECGVRFVSGSLADELHEDFVEHIRPLPNTDGLSYETRLRIVAAYRRTNRLLDFGCGFGGFLKEAEAQGWDVYGQDISPKAVSHVRDVLHLRNCFLSGERLDVDFDAIILWGVIEHLEDPAAILRSLLNNLRPGGVLVMQCPNAASLFYKLSHLVYALSGGRIDALMRRVYVPQHRLYFDEKSLGHLLSRQDLVVKSIEATNINLDTIFEFYRDEAWARSVVARSVIRGLNRTTKTHFEIVCERASDIVIPRIPN